MDAVYSWSINVTKTLAGPEVRGQVRAVTMQHVGVNDRFRKSIRLFVLRPIADADIAHPPDVTYYLMSLSPVYENGSYCLSVDPAAVGLKLKSVTVDEEGNFCFSHTLLPE